MSDLQTFDSNSLAQRAIEALRRQAKDYGVRRLLVVSGEQRWCFERAEALAHVLTPETLWVSETLGPPSGRIASGNARSVLGRELSDVIFDATSAIDADALAAVSGAISAGGFLVLLIPPWQHWESCVDEDSLRWCEKEAAIQTPRFIRYFKRCINEDKSVLIWRQGAPLSVTELTARPLWQRPDGQPTAQQNGLLQTLLHAPADNYVLIANRGRGKSALAGMLAAQWSGTGERWLTGPNKGAVSGALSWSNGKAKFIAPDLLLEICRRRGAANVDWLIVDEAAAIPAPLLYQLLPWFSRILFTTTVLGYEGTGRGFILKFCAGLPHWTPLTLSSPVRWADDDPLERFIDRLLLLDAENDASSAALAHYDVVPISQSDITEDEPLLRQFYGLLTGAHYRTTPLDLRRLFDAPEMIFYAAMTTEASTVGALWCVREGGVNGALAHEIWAGRRRPRGNLVAQSLSAHAGLYCAPVLTSVRVSRIAVNIAHRRQGVARRMIERAVAQCRADGVDFMSVSFGYTEPLAEFWQACGFHLIHMGSQKEASSGCYAAMGVRPLTAAGEALAQQGLTRFTSRQSEQNGQTLSEDDWRELAGFAFAHRTIESAFFPLARLLALCGGESAPALRYYVAQGENVAQISACLNLSGRKALIKLWRREASDLLFKLDSLKAERLKRWVMGLIEEDGFYEDGARFCKDGDNYT